MADRYWVGGTNSWNATAGTKWSTTSGGAGGASVPGATDNAIFDGNSGAGTVTMGATTCLNMNFDGTLSSAGTPFTGATATSINTCTISGGIQFSSAMTIGLASNSLLFNATSGTQKITFSGQTPAIGAVNFNGVGGTWQLQDDFFINASATATVTNGTFDANNKNVTAGAFRTAIGTKTITMGSGIWKLTGVGTVLSFSPTNLTLNANTSLLWVSDTSATAKTFSGQGQTYYNLQVEGAVGVGATTIDGGNTFNQIFFQPDSSVKFTASTTTTLKNAPYWVGTSGHQIVINSTGAAATLSYTGTQVVACDYLNISKSTASGTTPFYAGANSTDSGTNTNWTFTQPTAAANKFTAVVKSRPIPPTPPPESSVVENIQFNATPTPAPTTGYMVDSSWLQPPLPPPDSSVIQVPEYADITPAPVIGSYVTSRPIVLPPPESSIFPSGTLSTITPYPPSSAAVYQSEYFPTPWRPESAFIFVQPLGGIKYWNGSAWVAKRVKDWNGSIWVEKPMKFWTGTTWKITSY